MTWFVLLALCALQHDDPFRAGLLALNRGDLEAAQTNLERAASRSPQDGRIWIALAQTYWKLHHSDTAEAAAQKSEALATGNPAILEGLTIYYAETGRQLKAARFAGQLASLIPSNPQNRERAARLYFEAIQPLLKGQEFAESLTALDEAARLFAPDAQLQLARGVADYGLRRFDDAANSFLAVIRLSPEVPQPYEFLGRILDQIPSRLQAVAKVFASYQTTHPDDPLACLLYAKALNALSSEPEKSLRLLDRSLSTGAASASAYFEKGVVLDTLKRFDQAAAAFEHAVELAPNDPAAHYRLARDFDRLGRAGAALAERRKHALLVKAPASMSQETTAHETSK